MKKSIINAEIEVLIFLAKNFGKYFYSKCITLILLYFFSLSIIDKN